MDLTTILFILLVIVLAAAGVLAWLLYGPRAARPATQTPQPSPERTVQPRQLHEPQPTTPPATPTSPPVPSPGPFQPPPALDPDDPSVQLLTATSAQLAQTVERVRAVPQAMQERSAMRVELQAIEQRLADLRASMARGEQRSSQEHQPVLRKLAARLASIEQDSRRIHELLAELATHERELYQAAVALSAELNNVARLAPFPLAAEQTAGTSARVLGEVGRLGDRAALGSVNALKIRLRLVKELQAEIERSRAALEEAQRQRVSLLTLLAKPELAEEPSWHRALRTLHERSTAAMAPRLPSSPTAQLLAEGDRLLARRRALFDFCTPMPQGGVLLPEERLPAILGEAEAISAEVHGLWQRARELVGTARTAV